MSNKVIIAVILGLSLAYTGALAASQNGNNVTAGQASGQETQVDQQEQASQVEQQTQTANQGEANQIQTQNSGQSQTGNTEETGSEIPAQQRIQQRLQDGSGAGNQAQNQNQVKNQDEANKVKAGQQNGQQGQNAQGRRSQVANAVQAMLQIADRNGGIGQQVRTIAQAQKQNQEKLEESLEKVEKRGAFARFFIGPNYGEISQAKKVLAENQEQIKKLNEIKNQLVNQGDEQNLVQQIQTLTQTNLEIQNSLGTAQKGFSLFGWLNKLLSE